MNKNILGGVSGIFFIITLSCPVGAQEYYQVACTGNLFGANANIQGIYYLSKVFAGDNREVRFEGGIASARYGNGKIFFHDYYDSHPFDGEILSSHGRVPIRIWENLDANNLSGTWEIQENYPNTYKSQRYVGRLFCRAVG